MTWRWDSDAAYAAAEDHGQHVPGSLEPYDWDGFDAAGRILLAAIDSVLELLPPAPEGLTAGSSPARGLPLCVVCDDAGCSHCPGVAA